MNAKVKAIKSNLKTSSWCELKTNGKFGKNDELIFIRDDMFILGCDISSKTHS